ncbi:MAG: T9SS type A sorting domain-containing protein [Bacteroidota bacterium]
MPSFSCLLKLGIVSSLGFLLILPLQLWGQWEEATTKFITQDSVKQIIEKEHFTISADQHLHLIYQEIPIAGGSILYHTERDILGEWNNPTFINQDGLLVFNASLATHPTLSIPYVAYQAEQSIESEIFFAYRTSNGFWLTEQLTDNDLLDVSPSIKADPSGGIHICWIREVEEEFYLMYAYRATESSPWDIYPIENAFPGSLGESSAPKLAVNDKGQVHVTFRSGIIGNLRISYAFLASQQSDWFVERLPFFNNSEFEHDIAIDTDGLPKVVIGGLFTNNSWRVYEQKKDPKGDWRERNVIVSGGRGGLSSFWIDDQGYSHVLINVFFNSVANGRVNYYENTSGSWRVRALLGNGVVFAQTVNNAIILMDAGGQAYCAAYLGSSPEQQNVIVYGAPVPALATSTTSSLSDPYIQVFPNPAQDQVFMDIPSEVRTPSLSLYGLDGRMYHQELNPTPQEGQLKLELAGLSKGMYLLVIHHDKGVHRQMVIKE